MTTIVRALSHDDRRVTLTVTGAAPMTLWQTSGPRLTFTPRTLSLRYTRNRPGKAWVLRYATVKGQVGPLPVAKMLDGSSPAWVADAVATWGQS